MRTLTKQRGAVLVVSLVMLTVITLFVLSSISLNTTDLRIIGNMQSRSTLEYYAQQAIEDALSTYANFNAPAAQNVTVNGTPVAVSAPGCLGTNAASGYTAVWDVTLYDANWVVIATVSDPATGASAVVTQGVRIRQPSSYCP